MASSIPLFPTSSIKVSAGRADTLGATVTSSGVNFAIHAVSDRLSIRFQLPKWEEGRMVELLDLGSVDLDPSVHKTDTVWHAHVQSLPKGVLYSYSTEKAADLIDPYAKAIVSREAYRVGAYQPTAAVVDPADVSFDWEGVTAPVIADQDLIIYEMHARGFTQDISSKSSAAGTFRGITEKIEHFKRLGVNAIELMPVHEFNESDFNNYWGYQTLNFFSLMSRYSEGSTPEEVILEFKEMVRECHRNGIQVILDVVFNHTAEGNEEGPSLSYKGLDPEAYYMMKFGYHQNHSGCGNTFNVNNPVTSKLLIDALEYMVEELRVDGFRFDLAGSFTRDREGHTIEGTPYFLDAMLKSEVLSKVKLIAEPWDAATYQVGRFSGTDARFKEWNDDYRDHVRDFIKGKRSAKGSFAASICGSSGTFRNGDGTSSINFVACHDGFTLRDVVSYNKKTNANGGMDKNHSWNCGAEGLTEDPAVLALRERQLRNHHLALMVSQGIPMMLMGDEYGRSQWGNNNTWDIDGPDNYFDWGDLEAREDYFHFVSQMNKFRLANPLLRKKEFISGSDIEWHGRHPHKPNWHKDDPILAFTLKGSEEEGRLYVAFNNSDGGEEMTLPQLEAGKEWQWVANTGLEGKAAFLEPGSYQPAIKKNFLLGHRSAVILMAVDKTTPDSTGK